MLKHTHMKAEGEHFTECSYGHCETTDTFKLTHTLRQKHNQTDTQTTHSQTQTRKQTQLAYTYIHTIFYDVFLNPRTPDLRVESRSPSFLAAFLEGTPHVPRWSF